MSAEAVLISLQFKGSNNFNKASGILFSNNFVLVPGTILIPLLHADIPEHRKWVASFVKSSSSTLKANKHIHKVLFGIFREDKNSNETRKVKETKLLFQRSEVVGVWKCDLMTHSLKKLFYDWTFGYNNNKHDSRNLIGDDIFMSKELMSTFIILKCECVAKEVQNNEKVKSINANSAISNLVLEKPKRGQLIEVVSTPFGNNYFFNSLSRGIISNVIGEDCIILTDARTVSGCEGGPIFAANISRKNKERNKLIGLVFCPLTWWRGEWVGLTIGIGLVSVLKNLLKTTVDSINCNQNIIKVSDNSNEDSLPLKLVDETVILVRNQTSWGSGIVLDAASGTIITCSHVVKDSKSVSVFYKKQCHPATVIFSTQDDIAYDLAVIKSTKQSFFKREIEFFDKPIEVGDTVTAVGFPFFSESDDFNLLPSVVYGCIAKINPYMIQTTCCIQSGFSGGALLKDGKLLGIIVSNAREATSGALFPHINFVAPCSVFKEPVFNYIKTNDFQYLKALKSEDSTVQSVWALQTSKM